MAIDPICGMQVDEKTARSATRDGETFYFCCESCRQKFLARQADVQTERLMAAGAPAQRPAIGPTLPVLKASSSPPVPKSEGGDYICPMCPEVSSSRPGPCPQCGMPLERRSVAPTSRKTIYTCPMHPEV